MLISLAPMDWITDTAYRIICKHVFQKRGNPDDRLWLWTEFMSAEWYTHNPSGVVKHLMTLQSDEPHTRAQIFGGNKESLVQCAKDIDQKYWFQGIELNMGCPSPKIMKCEAWSAMLKDKKKSLDIIKTITQEISIPLSLKTRIWLRKDDIDEQFDFLLKASHRVDMIIIHGRTYAQGHSGDVNREFIYKLKKELPDTIIIGNGWIRSYEQALWRCNIATFQLLDGIMIGQSAIGNPRIFTPHIPSAQEKLEIILHHLDLSVACEIYFKQAIIDYEKYGKFVQPTPQDLKSQIPNLKSQISHLKSPIEFRKYLFNYISWLPESKKLKQTIIKIRDYHELRNMLQEYFQILQWNVT